MHSRDFPFTVNYYKSRNWNSFDDGKFYRRKWHDLDDIWKPNYDYDDFDEGVNSRSASGHVLNQQFNHYNNRYHSPFSNYRNHKQETYTKRECYPKNNNNSIKNTQQVSANEKTIKKEVSPQSSIQVSTNTNCKYPKVSEAKQETISADTVIKDTIDEELQLIHGDEVNKDCEISAKHFNINTRLSYLENYTIPTSELNQTQKQIRNVVQPTKSTTEDTKINKDFKQVETSSRLNTVMQKDSDKTKPHELPAKHDEHNTNNNSKANQIVLNTYMKNGESLEQLNNVLKVLASTNEDATKSKQQKDKSDKVLNEDFKKQKFSKLSTKTNSYKTDELCFSDSTKHSLDKSSKDILKLSKDTKKVYGKDEAETKESHRKRKKNVESCPTVPKHPKIISDKSSSGSNDLTKESCSSQSDGSFKKSASISSRRYTVTIPSESDVNSNQVLVFKTMDFGSGNVPKSSLDCINPIEKHAKISKRRMTVSVEPDASLSKVSKAVTDKSTLANVDVTNPKLNLDPTNTIKKHAKISKRRKTISSLLEADIDSVEVSETSLFGGIDVIKEKLISTKCASISKRQQTVSVPSDDDSGLTKTTTNKITGLRAMQSVDCRKATVSMMTRSKSKELKCTDIKDANSKQSDCNLLVNQKISSNSDKKHTPVEITKRASKVGRPKKIPHTPKEENMPDPRLQKSDECRMLYKKLEHSKVHSKNNSDKIRSDLNKSISEDTLNFLFGEKPKSHKKKVNRPPSNAKPATTCNLKRSDPHLTNNSKQTTPWNLNELDVSNQQLNIFFVVHNAPEEVQPYEPETTANLNESNDSQLLVKATETVQISTIETANSSCPPEVLNDQTVVTQITKSSIDEIIQGQKRLVCNVTNVDGVLVPNWTTNVCTPNNPTNKPQPYQQQISELVPSQFASTTDNVNSRSASTSINRSRVTHDAFIDTFYYFIFMYYDTYETVSNRVSLFVHYSFPQQQISREVQDFVVCFNGKTRRFAEYICKYFENSFIPSFSCKTLMWLYEGRYRKHTGQAPNTSHILNLFYCATKHIKKVRDDSGFLEAFCLDIETTYAASISNRNVPTQHNPQNQPITQQTVNPQNQPIAQQTLQKPQYQPRQQWQSTQNASVPQQPQQVSQRQLTQKLQHTQKQVQVNQRVSQEDIQQVQKVPHQQPQLPQRVAQLQTQHQISQKLSQPSRYQHTQHYQGARLPPSYHRPQQTEKLPPPPQYSESQYNRALRQILQSGKTSYSQGRSESAEVNDTTVNNRLTLTTAQRDVFIYQCNAYNLLINRYYCLFLAPPIPTSMGTSTTSILNSSSTEVSSTNRSIYSNLPTKSTGLLSNADNIQRTTNLQSVVTNTTTDNPTESHSFNNDTNSLQSDASTLLNNDVLPNVIQLPTSSNSIGTTDNFKIRLPLAQPREEKYSSTNDVSSTTNCNTEPSASNTSTDLKPKIEELLTEPEIIDVDEWFSNAIKSAEIIDLDYYFFDDEIKNEEPERVQSETSNSNLMEMNPRIGSVDSGISQSPNQLKKQLKEKKFSYNDQYNQFDYDHWIYQCCQYQCDFITQNYFLPTPSTSYLTASLILPNIEVQNSQAQMNTTLDSDAKNSERSGSKRKLEDFESVLTDVLEEANASSSINVYSSDSDDSQQLIIDTDYESDHNNNA
ncbi:hypothetical protein FQR65_LT03883 [Abscondita terminalis]|nr:hypothetical protein FQR65_LT03883 [Abscondita terminalis]